MSSRDGGLRGGKLGQFFHKVTAGDETIASEPHSKLYVEAICHQTDPSALRVNLSAQFLNTVATNLIHYLQTPDLMLVCGGELLQSIILNIVDPPIFWEAYVRAQKDGRLSDHSEECFSWLLLQLISFPTDKATPYYPMGSDPVIQKRLLDSTDLKLRTNGQRIKHIIDSITKTETFDLRGPGGRHDNDFEDIQNISILPTPDEIASTEEPFLRQAAEIDDCPEAERLGRHTDNQFRLLREDMLKDMREELQIVLGRKGGRRKGLHIQNLTLDGVECDERQGWALRLGCLGGLPQIPRGTYDDRLKFIKDNKTFLRHQSPACLIADNQLIALVILIRNQDLLAQEPPVVCLQISGTEKSSSGAILALKTSKSVDLVQLNTAIFAYEPVLRQLQKTRILSLKEEILDWTESRPMRYHSLSKLSKVKELIAKMEIEPDLDLQDILKLSNPTTLDTSQRDCFLASVKQRMSLVQGPPGTGKSFIGALIAKAIFQFSLKNILIVCYTNHALDQFLEDLLKVGVPGDSMVRLGSPHKASAAVQPLCMTAQQGNFKMGRDDWAIVNSGKNSASEHVDALKDAFQAFQASVASRSDIMEYLEFDSDTPDFYDAFLLPDEPDDMVRVGRKGKAINKYYLLDRWGRGQDPGTYTATQDAFPKIWDMPEKERQQRMMHWKREILKERVARIQTHGKAYNDALVQANAVFNEKDRMTINSKRIIGCTTTAAAKYVQNIQSASPQVLLVEEAGEILESHILTALGPETEQAILIGDHKQLRPKTHHDLSIEKGEGYDLNRSLFERLVLRGFPHQVLSKQHRMRPEISSLVRNLTYPDLIDAPKTHNRPNLKGFQDNLIFINHGEPEEEAQNAPDKKDQNATSSKKNTFEAMMTLKCVRYLAQQGYGTSKVVVLTPYLAQLRLLLDVLSTENDPILNDLDSYDLVQAGLMPAATAKAQKQKLRISTIDNYQGEESDIVIVSLTRSNGRHDIGFMYAPQRLNVLLSRARDALIMIGNLETFEGSRKGKDLWQSFTSLLKKGSHIYDGFPVKCERHPERRALLSTPADFAQCPDGGCNEPCSSLLRCGVHSCPQRCHQLFDHSKMDCQHVMQSKCLAGHQKRWKCYKGDPASCSTCDSERRAREKKEKQDFERQQRLQADEQEHQAQMAVIENEIQRLRMDGTVTRKAEEMARALEQRRQDLENARRQAADPVLPKTTERPASPVAKKGSVPGASVQKLAESVRSAAKIAKEGSQNNVLKSPSEVEWKRQKAVEGADNEAIDSLMKMTGLEDVKEQVLTIRAKAEMALRQNTNLADERFGVVLLGNPGTGKTTVARLYAKFLTSMGILNGTEFFEASGSSLANDGVAGARKYVEDLLKAGGGAFFLDEAYQLTEGHNYGGAAVLDFLLAEIENQVGKIVFIFAGYTKQMEKFFEHNPGLNERIPYRLRFADYSDKELLLMFERRVNDKHDERMHLEGGFTGLYARIAMRRLGRSRGREGFGNARALMNLIARISEHQAARIQKERAAGKMPDDFLLTKEDLIGPDPSNAILQSSAWKELQGLIGLKEVKDSVQSLINRISINYRRELQEREILDVSLNRVFIGSPGTGKTSVGKLYGQILADVGLLSNGEVVVKNPADFVGSVLGESEKNTKAILKATEGKVLIIDEAYMLYSPGSSAGGNTDPYKSSVVDTIVAEVQSTPGEDRCVLLLGYKDKMEEMFRNTNPGLARRFAMDDAFNFEDFNDEQLRQIMDLKLKKQDLDATEAAKVVAIEILARSRQRPNFGNAGEVENMIGHAKTTWLRRQRTVPLDDCDDNIVFEPQDFDEDFDRTSKAGVNCRELFKDVLGSDSVVEKLEGFVRSANSMKEKGIDPRAYIPFNFIFKGPPGTGKTTTARKMGEIFYSMGFLSTRQVHECSASDLVAPYVGQTALKTIQLLEKALGQVLFIDEAYRLGEGSFATEALNELVDSLTKPRFAGKLIVILAGYEEDINRLLSLNQGLSSRFSEEVNFSNMAPADCWTFLKSKIRKAGIRFDDDDDDDGEAGSAPVRILHIFQQLSAIPSWGNGRDVETISKTIIQSTFRSEQDLIITDKMIEKYLERFLMERQQRARKVGSSSTFSLRGDQAAHLPPAPSAPNPQISTTTNTATPTAVDQTEPPHIPEKEATHDQEHRQRDPGVTDSVWHQLQADAKAKERASAEREKAIANAEERSKEASLARQVAAEEEARAQAALLRARNAEMEEMKRRAEEARLREVAARRAEEEAREQLQRMRELAERERAREAQAQAKLRHMGVCVAGFRWIKQAGGYRCGGGMHFVGDGALGL